MRVIDFDDLAKWGSWVGDAVVRLAGDALVRELAQSNPVYIEDARDWVYERIGRDRMVAGLSGELHSGSLRLFHGTRLTDAEFEQVRQYGLKPLTLAERKSGIAAILRHHSRWSEVESRLDDAIKAFGPGAQAGRREDGCVHACFSRSGLVLGCNHYLTHGAEVDSHIGHHLFGDGSADRLFREHRKACLISFSVPFDTAARGSHSMGELEVGRGLLADMLIGSWAYGQAHPTFRITTQRDCTAAKIPGRVEPERLTLHTLDDRELSEN